MRFGLVDRAVSRREVARRRGTVAAEHRSDPVDLVQRTNMADVQLGLIVWSPVLGRESVRRWVGVAVGVQLSGVQVAGDDGPGDVGQSLVGAAGVAA